MKEKFLNAYMKTAETFAGLSSARRLHVGAIIVKDDRIISIGYNGMPSGWDNNCEDKIYCEDGDCSEQLLPKEANQWMKYKLVTKPEVLHAETNAIAKLAKSTESGIGATLLSLMPLVWIVQNWYISLVSIPFIIATVTAVKLAYNSWKKQEFR